MTPRPDGSAIGWLPVGERSMIDSRRCASPIPAPGSSQAPAPSGPRCAIVLAIRSARPAVNTPEQPAMPHIGDSFACLASGSSHLEILGIDQQRIPESVQEVEDKGRPALEKG